MDETSKRDYMNIQITTLEDQNNNNKSIPDIMLKSQRSHGSLDTVQLQEDTQIKGSNKQLIKVESQ